MISFSRIKNKRPFFVSRIQRKEVGHTHRHNRLGFGWTRRPARSRVNEPRFSCRPGLSSENVLANRKRKRRTGTKRGEQLGIHTRGSLMYVTISSWEKKEKETRKRVKKKKKRSRRPRPGFSLHHVSFHQLLFVLCVYVCVRLEVIFIRHSGSDGRGSSTDTNVCCRDTTHAGQTEQKGDSHTAIGYYLYSGSTQFIVHTQKEIESAVGRDNMRGPVLTGAGYRHLAR